MADLAIRPLGEADLPRAERLIGTQFSGRLQARLGAMVDALACPGSSSSERENPAPAGGGGGRSHGGRPLKPAIARLGRFGKGPRRDRPRALQRREMTASGDRYYRSALALVHHRGFGFHADTCAPGILSLLEPLRARRDLVVELGCGSGALTRHLVDASHRVVATDASPAMLDLAREHVPGAHSRQVVLPDDPIPAADAIVSVGHVLNYLADETSVDRALTRIADALALDRVLALDLCDREWGETRRDTPALGRAGDDWAILTEYSVPAPNRFVRQMAIFVGNDDGSWRRDDERHENVLVDTTRHPGLLAHPGVDAAVSWSFGTEQLPVGLRTVVGRRPAPILLDRRSRRAVSALATRREHVESRRHAW